MSGTVPGPSSPRGLGPGPSLPCGLRRDQGYLCPLSVSRLSSSVLRRPGRSRRTRFAAAPCRSVPVPPPRRRGRGTRRRKRPQLPPPRGRRHDVGGVRAAEEGRARPGGTEGRHRAGGHRRPAWRPARWWDGGVRCRRLLRVLVGVPVGGVGLPRRAVDHALEPVGALGARRCTGSVLAEIMCACCTPDRPRLLHVHLSCPGRPRRGAGAAHRQGPGGARDT